MDEANWLYSIAGQFGWVYMGTVGIAHAGVKGTSLAVLLYQTVPAKKGEHRYENGLRWTGSDRWDIDDECR